MIISTTNKFDKDYKGLSGEHKRHVKKALYKFEKNQKYPSLRIKAVKGTRDVWEMTAADNLRITFQKTERTVILRRVGTHSIFRKP